MVDTDQLDPMRLFPLLEDNRRPLDNQLPDTGVGLDWERLLSTIFIDGDMYGTRSSAVITVSDEGDVRFIERTIKRSPAKDIISQFIRHSMNGSYSSARRMSDFIL
jgi:uncharacterized protein with NRDE domain